MPTLNLSPYGYNVDLEIEGQVLNQTVAGGPLLFLFDEDHESPQGIGASVRNALKLIDAGVVDFVAVEETPQGVREEVERLVTKVWKAPSLEAYSASLRERFPNDTSVVNAAIKLPEPRFGRILLIVRPSLPVFSVDDVELCARAEHEHNRLLEEYEVASPQRQKEIRIHFSQLPVHRERDPVFVKKLLALRESVGASRATILNAGGRHNDRIPDLLPEEVSVVRIRPSAYIDPTVD